MMDQGKFEFYENQLKQLDKPFIPTYIGRAAGQENQRKNIENKKIVYDILKKYTDTIYPDVVIWNRKHTLTCEMDFLCIINGFLVVIDIKNWFGVIEKHPKPYKVCLCFTNSTGRYIKEHRVSPIAAMGGFINDLVYYLGQTEKLLPIRRFIIFSRNRDELILKDEFETKSTLCYLDDFESYLKILAEAKNEFPYVLPKPLPSWDYYFDTMQHRWFKVVFLSDTIETAEGNISINDIDSIYFSDEDNDRGIFKMKDGSFLSSKVNRKSILLSSKLGYAHPWVKYIKLNSLLHSKELITDNKETLN